MLSATSGLGGAAGCYVALQKVTIFGTAATAPVITIAACAASAAVCSIVTLKVRPVGLFFMSSTSVLLLLLAALQLTLKEADVAVAAERAFYLSSLPFAVLIGVLTAVYARGESDGGGARAFAIKVAMASLVGGYLAVAGVNQVLFHSTSVLKEDPLWPTILFGPPDRFQDECQERLKCLIPFFEWAAMFLVGILHLSIARACERRQEKRMQKQQEEGVYEALVPNRGAGAV